MNIALLTSYTKYNPWTIKNDCDFMLVSLPNHLNYCQKYDLSYIVDIYENWDFQKIHPTWVKIYSLKKFLHNFDYIIWIDGDCIIKNFEIDIKNFISNSEIELVLCKTQEDRRTKTVWTSITSGFMIFKNCKWSFDFLDNLISNMGSYSHEYFHEQSLIDQTLLNLGYFDNNDLIKNKNQKDIDDFYKYKNLLVLPSRYQNCNIEDHNYFLFHAGGNSSTKKQRLLDCLNN